MERVRKRNAPDRQRLAVERFHQRGQVPVDWVVAEGQVKRVRVGERAGLRQVVPELVERLRRSERVEPLRDPDDERDGGCKQHDGAGCRDSAEERCAAAGVREQARTAQEDRDGTRDGEHLPAEEVSRAEDDSGNRAAAEAGEQRRSEPRQGGRPRRRAGERLDPAEHGNPERERNERVGCIRRERLDGQQRHQ